MSQYFNEKTATHPVINKLQTHLALASRNKFEMISAPKKSQDHSTQHQPFHMHFGNAPHLPKDLHPESANTFKFESLPSFSSGIRINFGIAPPTHSNSGYKFNTLKATSSDLRPNVNSQQTLLNTSYKANPGNWLLQNNNNIDVLKLRKPEIKNEFKPSTQIHNNQTNRTTFYLSTVPPSILTPFFQQVQQQQQNSVEALKINYQKYNWEQSSEVFKPINVPQVLKSQNLLPYPKKYHTHIYENITTTQADLQTESYNTYKSSDIFPSNLSSPAVDKNKPLNQHKMTSLSPLQDANKFSYKIVASEEVQATTPTTSLHIPYKTYDNFTTTPNPYIKFPSQTITQHVTAIPYPSKIPFLPTPIAEETITKNNIVTNSYFTVEEAMTVLPEGQTKFYESSSIQPEVPVTGTILLPTHANNIIEIANKTGSKALDNIIIRQKSKRKRPKPLATVDDRIEYKTTTTAPLSRTRLNFHSSLVTKNNSKEVSGPIEKQKKIKSEITSTPKTVIHTYSTQRPKPTTVTSATTLGRNKSGNNFRLKPNDVSTRITQKSEVATTAKNNILNLNNNRFNTKQTTVKAIQKTEKARTQSPLTTINNFQLSNETISNDTRPNRFKPMTKQRPKFSIKDYKNKLATKISPIEEVKPTDTNLIPNVRIKYPVRTRLRNNMKNKLNSTVINKVPNVSENIILTIKSESQLPEVKRTKLEPSDEKFITTTETSRTSNRRGSTKRGLISLTRSRTTSATPEFTSSSETTESSIQNVVDSLSKTENENILNDLSIDKKFNRNSFTTESYKHETAIMKIAKDDSYKYKISTVPSVVVPSVSDYDLDLNESSSDYSKRIAELTLSVNKDHTVKFVNSGIFNRKLPGYFTLATDNPILPIEAFFPQYVNIQNEKTR
jgi:hypothetical protein